jgi:hypothetical protein
VKAEQALANLRTAHEQFAGELMRLELATLGGERGPLYKRKQDNAYWAALKLRKEIDILSARYGLKGIEEVQI